jgi:hypothetical protein
MMFTLDPPPINEVLTNLDLYHDDLMINNHCCIGMFKLNWLKILNWFENVSFVFWRNFQELPQVDNILNFQNLNTNVFQNFLQNVFWCYCLWK